MNRHSTAWQACEHQRNDSISNRYSSVHPQLLDAIPNSIKSYSLLFSRKEHIGGIRIVIDQDWILLVRSIPPSLGHHTRIGTWAIRDAYLIILSGFNVC